MDFIEGLPLSHDFSVIFVVVDRLSKYSNFMALKHPLAQTFFGNVFQLHSMPTNIVFDRGLVFFNHFWIKLFKFQGVSLAYFLVYHLQSDGQTEIFNKRLEEFLQCFTGDKAKHWHQWLTLAEWWFNTNFHSSTKATPYKIVYGKPPPKLSRYIPGQSPNQAND